jgi:hypothetical protein
MKKTRGQKSRVRVPLTVLITLITNKIKKINEIYFRKLAAMTFKFSVKKPGKIILSF